MPGVKQALKESQEILAEAAPKAVESVTTKPLEWIADSLFGGLTSEATKLDPKKVAEIKQQDATKAAQIRRNLEVMSRGEQIARQETQAKKTQTVQTQAAEEANKRRNDQIEKQNRGASIQNIQRARTNLEGGKGRQLK